jgi:hypothetical protein
MAVADVPTVLEPDGIVIRQESIDGGFDPGDAGRNEGLLTALGLFAAEDTRAHERPARLVGMAVGRLDDRDVEVGSVTAQFGRNRDARCTTPDDQHGVLQIRGGSGTRSLHFVVHSNLPLRLA